MDKIFLETHDVVKRYANHTALNGVSIKVPEGKVFGLLGPNGAGKTTLIRIINRITVPDSGSVTFNGHPLSVDDICNIGYLPEERGLYKKMRVGEQAIYLARLKGLDKAEAEKRQRISSGLGREQQILRQLQITATFAQYSQDMMIQRGLLLMM